MPLTLQQELKRLRKKKNLTQGEVADGMKMQRSTYARKEVTGEFTLDELTKLSKLLGTNIRVLSNLDVGHAQKGVVRNEREYMIQQAILMEAFHRVILSALAELLAKQRGELPSKTLSSLEEAVNHESVKILRKLQ